MTWQKEEGAQGASEHNVVELVTMRSPMRHTSIRSYIADLNIAGDEWRGAALPEKAGASRLRLISHFDGVAARFNAEAAAASQLCVCS